MSDFEVNPPGPAAEGDDPDQPGAKPASEEPTRPVQPVDPDKTVPTQPRARPSSADRPTQPSPPRPYRQVPPPKEPPPVPPHLLRRPVPPPPPPRRRPVNWGRLIWRTFLATTFGVVLLLALGVAFAVVGYFWIASELPRPEELQLRQFQFETTNIYDRNGNLLWEIVDPNFGRRTYVPISNIDRDVINATVATEDRFFYQNVGVDPIAVTRAVYYNVTEGRIVSGGSTITQQLVRNILLEPDERNEQSMMRKVREAVLAVEIFRQYPKDKILEIYLNQIYYGNLAYGIEAASETYFGKSADDLSIAEAALLAGLPQSPAIYDPFTNPAAARRRQEVVIDLMVEAGYLSPAQAQAARAEDVFGHLDTTGAAFKAPHFINYIRAELETIFPPDLIYQAGLRIETTLDPRLQAIAEEEIANQVNALAARNVTNGALVAIRPQTGELLAMVGSKDFRDKAISGQINMAISPRQPGSSIKPLTYLAAFERGWTPSTLIMDVPTEYPDGAGGVYRPKNYDDKFHGPVSVRVALANSYNIPAVKALEYVGLGGLKEMAARLGITTLTRNDYGLALTLGGGEVPLVEMAGAYQAMANGGVLLKPVSILRVTDKFGNVIYEFHPEPGRRVLREEHAYLISHILADNEARSIAFGPNSNLKLSRPAAAKTGTTNDFRDNWTIGYTPDLVVGVWVGNADYTPMQGVSGLSGAGPIWHNFMERAHEGLPVRDFIRPPTIVEIEICADSGTLPSQACPERRREVFAQDQPPLGSEFDVHQLIDIDLNTGLRANEFCRGNVETRYYRVYPPDGRQWAEENGFPQPPEGFCPSRAIEAAITYPGDGATVKGIITLEGRALAADFSHYQLEIGVGTGPQAFAPFVGPVNELVEGGPLATVDTRQVDNGPYTIRLLVFDRNGGSLESRVLLVVDNDPTPTPTATSTPTVTPTGTPTPTETPTPTVAVTDTVTPTPPVTEEPTPVPATPTTPLAADTPTPGVTPSPAGTVAPTPGATPTSGGTVAPPPGGSPTASPTAASSG